MAKSERTGMFTKDKLYGIPRLDETVTIGERFIVLGVGSRTDVIPTDIGDARPAWLIIQQMEDLGDGLQAPVITQTVATAIVNNCEQAVSDDFPAVCYTKKIPSRKAGYNDAFVLNWESHYEGQVADPSTWPDIPSTVNGAACDGRFWEDGTESNDKV